MLPLHVFARAGRLQQLLAIKKKKWKMGLNLFPVLLGFESKPERLKDKEGMRQKPDREHACGTASGHKGRNLRHHCDVHAHAQTHRCDVSHHRISLVHRNFPSHTLQIVTETEQCSKAFPRTQAGWAHSCYWLPVITSTLFPQAGTKNNSLLQCG